MSAGVAVARVVADLALSQWGLITTAQARAEGLTGQQLARLADAGALERLRHGVYRVAGSPPRLHEDLSAAWLALSPAKTAHERLADDDVEVVSHRSAAVMHELGDLDADRLEFTTRGRRQTRDTQVRLHRRRRGAGAWTLVDGLPVTTVLTTIGDLAATLLDGGHLAGVVRDAVTTHHVDVAEVSAVLSPYAHRYGAPLGQGGALLDALLDQAGVPMSIPTVRGSAISTGVNEAARAVAEQVIDGRVLHDAVVRVLDSGAVRAAIERALESDAVSRVVEHALGDGGALQEAVKRATESTVRDAVERAMNAPERSGR
jgi:predicted transcriptional regulator of viral defense system